MATIYASGLDTLTPTQRVVADRAILLLDEWRGVLGLEKWGITVKFVATEEKTEDGVAIWAKTQTDWAYQYCKLFLYGTPLNPEDCNEYELEETILHELLHSTVEPLVSCQKANQDRTDRTEFVVVNLTRAFLNSKYGVHDASERRYAIGYYTNPNDGPVQQTSERSEVEPDSQIYH